MLDARFTVPAESSRPCNAAVAVGTMAMSGQSVVTASQGSALDAYRRILDTLPAAGSLCDADGRVIHYSPQAAALWGWSPPLADHAPRYCGAHRFLAPDGTVLARESSPMARALRERVPVHGEHVRIARPDGTERVAIAYASPMLDDGGRVQGGLALLVDVTERHAADHAQAERMRQREELRVALACDIRAGLDPLRRTAQDLAARAHSAGRDPAEAVDRQLRHVTQLVDRLLNLEVDLDDAIA